MLWIIWIATFTSKGIISNGNTIPFFLKDMKINIKEVTFRNLLILENLGFSHAPISRHTTGKEVGFLRPFWWNARKLNPVLNFLVIRLFKGGTNRYNRYRIRWCVNSKFESKVFFLRWIKPMHLKWPYSSLCERSGHFGPLGHRPFEPVRPGYLSCCLRLTRLLHKAQFPSKCLPQ